MSHSIQQQTGAIETPQVGTVNPLNFLILGRVLQAEVIQTKIPAPSAEEEQTRPEMSDLRTRKRHRASRRRRRVPPVVAPLQLHLLLHGQVEEPLALSGGARIFELGIPAFQANEFKGESE